MWLFWCVHFTVRMSLCVYVIYVCVADRCGRGGVEGGAVCSPGGGGVCESAASRQHVCVCVCESAASRQQAADPTVPRSAPHRSPPPSTPHRSTAPLLQSRSMPIGVHVGVKSRLHVGTFALRCMLCVCSCECVHVSMCVNTCVCTWGAAG